MLANNSQHCRMLQLRPFAHPVAHSICTPCCMLLSVSGSCCAKFETGQTFEPITPNISFVPYLQSVTQQYWIRLHSSSNIAGATHAPKMAVEFLWGCILPIMHCRCKHCWELFHPFSHHCNTDATTVFVLVTLSKDVFERRTSTGSEAFSLFICLDANKLVLLSFFSLLKTIYPRVSTKPLPSDAKSSLPVDVRRSKTLLLKLPIVGPTMLGVVASVCQKLNVSQKCLLMTLFLVDASK